MDSTKKFDPTKPVQTRDGRPVRILCTDVKSQRFPIVAAVLDSNGFERVITYATDGRELIRTETELDLMNIPEETTEWVNYYEDIQSPSVWKTCEEADVFAAHYREALFKVTKVDGKVTKVEVVQ